ncbi:MAG: hypothetical protein WAK29_20955, partial [Terriglobales bacterium]
MKLLKVVLFAALTVPLAMAQPSQSSDTAPESAKPAASKKDKKQPPASAATPDKSEENAKPTESPKAEAAEATEKEEHYDVSEVPPVITHHQIALNGKTL